MLEPWNCATLLPPPVNMFLCTTKFDVSALKHVFNSITKALSKQSPLHKESAICSRFLYKYDKKFRNDMGYRNLRKVNTALKKYLALNLLREIQNFSSALPSEYDDLYLPTRQMLEFVLLRIIAFSKIMLRVCVCSKQAAVFYLDRIKRGESHWMSLLPYSLLSRLWSMSMVLLQHTVTWYSNLYPYLTKLQLKGLNFLPDNYKLPEDLEQWLDLKHLDNFGRFDWAQKKYIEIDNAAIDGDDNDMFDNILSYVNQTNEDQAESDQEEVIQPFPSLEERKEEDLLTQPTEPKIDHGEVLSRESYKVLLSAKKDIIKNNKTAHPNPTPANLIKHSYKNITNSNSLKKFIEREESFRNESDSKALTSHLSLMQWHALKTALLKLHDPLNRKIERKFLKIWKEKCLDYM